MQSSNYSFPTFSYSYFRIFAEVRNRRLRGGVKIQIFFDKTSFRTRSLVSRKSWLIWTRWWHHFSLQIPRIWTTSFYCLLDRSIAKIKGSKRFTSQKKNRICWCTCTYFFLYRNNRNYSYALFWPNEITCGQTPIILPTSHRNYILQKPRVCVQMVENSSYIILKLIIWLSIIWWFIVHTLLSHFDDRPTCSIVHVFSPFCDILTAKGAIRRVFDKKSKKFSRAKRVKTNPQSLVRAQISVPQNGNSGGLCSEVV